MPDSMSESLGEQFSQVELVQLDRGCILRPGMDPTRSPAVT
jgi:hypothetical protein